MTKCKIFFSIKKNIYTLLTSRRVNLKITINYKSVEEIVMTADAHINEGRADKEGIGKLQW